MNRTIRLAMVKKISKKVLIKEAYEKNKNYKGWKVTYVLFSWMYEQMQKRGFLQPYYDDVVVDTYDYTPSKEKLLSHRVMEAIHRYERDFHTAVDPDKYVVVMAKIPTFKPLKRVTSTLHFSTSLYNFPLTSSTMIHMAGGVLELSACMSFLGLMGF